MNIEIKNQEPGFRTFVQQSKSLTVQKSKSPKVQKALLLLLMLTGTAAYAQLLPDREFKEPASSNEYSVYGVGGLSKLIYTTASGTANMGVSYGAGLEYTLNFSSTIGVSAGLEYSRFAGSFRQRSLSETYDAIDDAGSHFDYIYSMEEYEETQSFSVMSMPMLLRVKLPVGRNNHIFAGGGVKFALPVGSKVSIAAKNINSSGYYAQEDVTYSNLPQHGFYSGLNVRDGKSGIKGFTTMTILTFEAGFRIGSRRNALYIGAYFDYLPTDGGRLRNKHPMNYQGAITYESILSSAMSSELKMMNAGVKLKFSLF